MCIMYTYYILLYNQTDTNTITNSIKMDINSGNL